MSSEADREIFKKDFVIKSDSELSGSDDDKNVDELLSGSEHSDCDSNSGGLEASKLKPWTWTHDRYNMDDSSNNADRRDSVGPLQEDNDDGASDESESPDAARAAGSGSSAGPESEDVN
ncbi:hypothetical protein H0H92_015527 [Tricholoma furcatifolium]|nr:hypothetical protein H0H92_015527 [Tricholoma furcatifolium]